MCIKWTFIRTPSGHIYKQKTTFYVHEIINVSSHIYRPNTLVIQ